MTNKNNCLEIKSLTTSKSVQNAVELIVSERPKTVIVQSFKGDREILEKIADLFIEENFYDANELFETFKRKHMERARELRVSLDLSAFISCLKQEIGLMTGSDASTLYEDQEAFKNFIIFIGERLVVKVIQLVLQEKDISFTGTIEGTMQEIMMEKEMA